jgi:hypothetical protein
MAVSALSVYALQGCKPHKAEPVQISASAAATQKSKSECYRNSIPAGMPFDYNLWGGEKACKSGTCAPAPALLPETKVKIDALEKNLPLPASEALPADEKQLEAYLHSAENNGSLTCVGGDNREIYRTVQSEIDSSSPGQDLHLIFGTTHFIKEHPALFNDILNNTNGISAVALEYYRLGANGFDYQSSLDKYLMASSDGFGFSLISNSSNVQDQEVEERSRTLRMGRDKCLNVIFSEPEASEAEKIKDRLGKYYWIEARDIAAVRAAGQRLDPSRKNIVAWERGASHIHLSELIKGSDPNAKTVTFIVNGGAYVSGLAFDRVLKNMGWLERSFILKVNGYYILHLPTAGREMDIIPRSSNAVVRETYSR